MNSRTLQLVQSLLLAAISIVLAAAVFTAFVRVIQTRDTDPVAMPTTTTTLAVTSTTVEPTTTTTTTTTTIAPGEVPWGAGPCQTPTPDLTGDVTVLRVYYNCGGDLRGPTGATRIVRVVSSTPQRLTATMRSLVTGPTEEERAVGFGSYFSQATANVVDFVTISDGTAIIEFIGLETIDALARQDPLASVFFVGNLHANVFQFDSVSAAEFRLNGSCDEFWRLVAGTGCQVTPRADWEEQAAANRG